MFTVVIDRPGDSSLELTPITNSCQWDSAAVGGFGACSFSLPGIVRPRDLPYLATARLYFGSLPLWEGRIEDRTPNYVANTTQVQAFGWKRALDFTTVRRIWSKRDLEWQPIYSMSGSVYYDIGLTTGAIWTPSAWGARFGSEDSTNADLQGSTPEVTIYPATLGITPSPGQCNGMIYTLPVGLAAVRVMFTGKQATASGSGSRCFGSVQSSIDGSTWTLEGSALVGNSVTGTDESVALTASSRYVKLIGDTSSAGGALSAGNGFRFQMPRILGTSITEEATGGFYGGTLLRDLVALLPELSLGNIEAGTDFLIESLDRAVRSPAASVVDEVASYYAREWAVWEAGRFDWATPNLDEPQFVFNVADCTELELTGSLDTLVGTSYVLYTDAATGIDAEASSPSTSQRNPFIRTGQSKHDLTSPGFVMTANTSAQLAARIAAERGQYPPVTGRCVLPAQKRIKDHTGQEIPAFAIRAGRNIYIPDLPKDELLTAGRDGQTLFHVVTCETNMEAETVTLELEGQGRQLDVILARLAAVTRTLTG